MSDTVNGTIKPLLALADRIEQANEQPIRIAVSAADAIRSCIATPANATDTAGLEQRLRAMQDAETWYDGGYRPVCLVNPDGPEAADALAALRAENERLTAERDRQYEENVHRIVEQTKAEARCDRLQAELARMRDRLTSPEFLRPLIQEQSAGEWDDKTIDADVETFAAAIRAALTDSQKETGA